MLTLHEAIAKVLKEAGKPLSADEIAQKVNEHKLYVRNDGNPVPTSQIHARIKKYPNQFYFNKGLISLIKLNESILFNPPFGLTENYLDESVTNVNLQNLLKNIEIKDDESQNSLRKNIIYQIRKEVSRDGHRSIGELNKDGVKMAVAAAGIYSEIRGESLKSVLRKFRTTEEYSDDELKEIEFVKDFSTVLIDLIEKYLNTYKVFTGKDLIQFYLDLIEDWGMSWDLATPLWISQLMARLANPKVDAKVWDPATGTARTLLEVLEVNPFADIFGCEINPEVHKLARAVLTLEKVVSSGIINCDSLSNSSGQFSSIISDQPGLYDLVISDPPKGKLKYKDSKGRIGTWGEGSEIFLATMISNTEIGGTVVCIVSDSFLTNNLSQKNRSELLKHTWLKAIVSLPLSTFGPHTGTKNSLMLLKRKKEDDTIEPFPARFIDSEEIIKQIHNEFPGINELENHQELIDRIDDLVQSKSISTSKVGKDVSHKDLLNAEVLSVNYHLSESWTTLKMLEDKGENLLPLSVVLTTPKTSRYSKGDLKEDIYIIQPRDLYSERSIQSLINSAGNQINDDPDTTIRVLEESVILVNRRVDYFAPTYVEIDKRKAGININIFAFGWDENFVIPEYVVSQLKSDLVKQQLDAMAIGSTYRYVQKKDILSIKIPVPFLSEQYEFIKKTESVKVEKTEIAKFISQIQLVETKDELKKELERYVRENHFPNNNPRFLTEMDFKVFPFSLDEVKENKWFKLSDDKHFAYILLLSKNKIFGVLVLENINRLNYETYYEINTYTEFLFKLTRHILSSTASSNLAKFAHTTKNFLLNLHEPLKAIANTQNQELKDLLSRHYIDTEEAIDLMIKGGEGKKEDFLAINVLQDALKRISLYTSFFKKISEIYHQIVKDNLEKINIIDIIRAADTDKAVQLLDDKQSVFVNGKHKSILLAFTDLIQNACKYSPDRKCKIQVVEEIYHVEIIISNKVKDHCMMDKEFYENLGKDWVTRDSGTGTGSGFFSARQSIEDSNGELHKAPFEEYVMNKEFKIVIKLKTN
ncbi:MAG: N-6 DNA methylase [Bacteroidales bacterium]|nr:N-6 DNA methylase [Bacteroidales bacterium]